MLKKALIQLAIKLMHNAQVKSELLYLTKETGKQLPIIPNSASPYAVENSKLLDGEGVIFISSRFRSGSTMLWNAFRNCESTTAYYEPFNERKWFSSETRGSFVDSSHLGVDDYWLEYDNLESLAEYYNERWIDTNLLMTKSCVDINMRKYTDALIAAAKKRPVLQFNRIDFRLEWFKKQYPKAVFIHLYRNPRDQFLSFLTDKKLMNADDVVNTYKDAFYLDTWCNNLKVHYPFLDKKLTPEPYKRFYYLWKLSYLYGKKYADISVSFEEIIDHNSDAVTNLLQILNMRCERESFCAGIERVPIDKWRSYASGDWFDEQEQYCETELNSVMAFTG